MLNKENIQNDINSVQEDDLYRLLESNEIGLSENEAEHRSREMGKNLIAKKRGTPVIIKFLSNFTHLMALLLWGAGIIALVGDMLQLAIAIWMVNVINGVFSFWQEFRAGKATEALQKMLSDYARVLRDGKEQKILVEDVVVGDIILLSEGDKVPADARIIEENDLYANQSTLTGESRPVNKTSDISMVADLSRTEQPNLVFAGTSIASGTGKAIVYATGMDTEFGNIAGLTQNMKEEPSPLQKEMNKVTKVVSVLAVSIGIIFFLMAVFFVKLEVWAAFIFAMGMIVAYVPEGLLPTVTLSLAMGVQRMAKRNALIKRLSAVETLGCTNVICTDKTGTLTQNEMTVTQIWCNNKVLEVTGVGYDAKGGQLLENEVVFPQGDSHVNQLLCGAALCCDARVLPPDEKSAAWTVLGDPTEAALLVLAEKYNVNLTNEEKRMPRLRELPFDSSRKRMSTIHQNSAERISFTKGAPKEVLDFCTEYKQGETTVPMTKEIYNQIMEQNDSFARNGLRVLAIATRNLTNVKDLPAGMSQYTSELIEKDMIFLGLIAMVDPPRPEVAKAVKKCHKAGIRIVMITGDYGLTAESIAKRIGIVKKEHPMVITGVDLEKMTDEELKSALTDEVIFARVAPEQKLQVVTAFQEMGQIVAVTGDGVNDSPALKKADIGVAMGLSGTDVAKEAADMILTDDNFASIVGAIEEGRAVYNNIRKFAMYIFNSNMAAAIPMIFFLFSKGLIPLPLTVMQVLAIDLGTDLLPAMGLGAEAPDPGIMDVAPRSQKEPLLTKKILARAMLWYGLLQGLIATVGFFFVNSLVGWPNVALADSGVIYKTATIMTFACIVFGQIGAVFACRTNHESVFKRSFIDNKLIVIGVAVEILLVCALSYLPFTHELFHSAPLEIRHWMFLICIPFVLLGLDEIRKAFLRKQDREEQQKLALIKKEVH